MTFCPKCGKEIDGAPKFCPNCGNQLDLQDNVKEQQESPPAVDKKSNPNSMENAQKRMARVVLCLLIFIGVLSIFIKMYAIGFSFLAVGVICLYLSFSKEKREAFIKKCPKPVLIAAIAVIVCAFAFPFVKDFVSNNSGSSRSNSSKSNIVDITSNPSVSPWLSLESYNVDKGEYGTKIVGVIAANVPENITINSGAIVRVKFYDEDGAILDEKYDISKGLKSGDKWKFEVIVPIGTSKYEITSIEVYD